MPASWRRREAGQALATDAIFRPNPRMPRNDRPACRIFSHAPLAGRNTVEPDAEQAHYLRSVMRLAVGATVTLFDGHGGEYDARITRLDKSGACCALEAFHDIERELPCRVDIIQAACRGEKIETVLQKGTELGAHAFHIARSERAQLKLAGDRLKKRMQRWQKIIVEAAEQSGRTRIPELAWHDALADVPACGLKLALHPEGAQAWAEMRDRVAQAEHITLAVGPEGGFSERDMERLAGSGFSPLRFGARIMRTETAAPALLAAIAAVR